MADRMAKNMAELNKLLLEQCKQLCEYASNEVYEAINYFLNQYYTEWEPIQYSRSYDMLHSAFKTTVRKVGNGYEAVVGIDYESLDNYKDATGFEVVTWANSELHGGLNVNTNTRVFDDAINSTISNGQLLKDCVDYLKGKGFTITV